MQKNGTTKRRTIPNYDEWKRKLAKLAESFPVGNRLLINWTTSRRCQAELILLTTWSFVAGAPHQKVLRAKIRRASLGSLPARMRSLEKELARLQRSGQLDWFEQLSEKLHAQLGNKLTGMSGYPRNALMRLAKLLNFYATCAENVSNALSTIGPAERELIQRRSLAILYSHTFYTNEHVTCSRLAHFLDLGYAAAGLDRFPTHDDLRSRLATYRQSRPEEFATCRIMFRTGCEPVNPSFLVAAIAMEPSILGIQPLSSAALSGR